MGFGSQGIKHISFLLWSSYYFTALNLVTLILIDCVRGQLAFSLISSNLWHLTQNGNNVVDDCGIIANHYTTERFSGIENQTRSPTNNINNFNIIAISESRLNTTVINAEVKIAGYKLSRLDRLTKQGGGVWVYTCSSLKKKVLKDLTCTLNTGFHQLWLQVQRDKQIFSPVCYVQTTWLSHNVFHGWFQGQLLTSVNSWEGNLCRRCLEL